MKTTMPVACIVLPRLAENRVAGSVFALRQVGVSRLRGRIAGGIGVGNGPRRGAKGDFRHATRRPAPIRAPVSPANSRYERHSIPIAETLACVLVHRPISPLFGGQRPVPPQHLRAKMLERSLSFTNNPDIFTSHKLQYCNHLRPSLQKCEPGCSSPCPIVESAPSPYSGANESKKWSHLP